jgi:hypothetical protein
MAAIARVETGSLTPTLSRGERVSHIPHGDMPELQPSEPSRLVPANTRLRPSKPAGNILPLPPGEGRDEGRSLHSSLHGSWSQYVSNYWKSFHSMNLSRQAIARVEPGSLTPPLSRGERESLLPRNDTLEPRPCEPSRLVPANARLSPPKPAAHLLLLPPGEGRDEGRSLHPRAPVHGPWASRFRTGGCPYPPLTSSSASSSYW